LTRRHKILLRSTISKVI